MGHIPVMLEESLQFFREKKLISFFDATLGLGGFADRLLEEHPEIVYYFGCDRDEEALRRAQRRLARWNDKMIWIHGNFADLDKHLQDHNMKQVDGFFLI